MGEVDNRTSFDGNQINSLWYVLDDYCITDAIALSAGYEPKVVENNLNDHGFENTFPNYSIIKKLIFNAIYKGELPAQLIYDQNPNIRYVTDKNAFLDAVSQGRPFQDFVSSERAEPNWRESTISQSDLKEFLNSKGLSFPFHGEIDFDSALRKQVAELSNKLATAREQLSVSQKINKSVLLHENLRIALDILDLTWGEWTLNPKLPIPPQDYIKSKIKEKYPGLNETLVLSIDRVIAPFDRSKTKVDEAKAAFIAKLKAL